MIFKGTSKFIKPELFIKGKNDGSEHVWWITQKCIDKL